jgi:peptide chain release factor 2
MKNLADLRDELIGWHAIVKRINDALELANLGDESLGPDLETEVVQIEKETDRRELSILLSGPYDKGNAILAIHSGAGGTDSQDWAAMLERS